MRSFRFDAALRVASPITVSVTQFVAGVPGRFGKIANVSAKLETL
jgi:hypothetical protein